MRTYTKIIILHLLSGTINFLYSQTGTYIPQYRPYISINDQGFYSYGAAIPFSPSLIADDFGPRKLDTDSYDWHGGIDYNSGSANNGYGDLLLAIEGGTVNEQGIIRDGTKWITIEGDHNFTYVHVFKCTDGIAEFGIPDDGIRINGCLLKKLDNYSTWAIIFQINGAYNAIGPTTPSTGYVTFTDEQNIIHTLTVSTHAAEGAPIAPLGNSCSFTPHAHLQDMAIEPTNSIPPWSDEYAKNPLETVQYTISNNNIQLLKENDFEVGVTLGYPGVAASTLQARVQIDAPNNISKRYNTVMDIEEVEFLIKKNYVEDYSTIKGAHNNNIKFGGMINSAEFPDYINNSGNNNNVGSWNKTGVEPFCYYSHPWDDFYCKDFITRIHKDDPTDGATTPNMISYCPMSTRYNDGRYHIKARVTDVRNGYTDSPVQNVVIDNYKPFIREVKAEVNNQVIYRRTWQCDDGANCQGMYLENGVVQADANRSDLLTLGMWVTVTGSEALLGLKLNINSLIMLPSSSQSEGGRIWHYYIPPYQLESIMNNQAIEFVCHSAYDAANNPMIGFNRPDAALACQKIPTRKDSKSWTNDKKHGADKLHFFNINCGDNRRSSPDDEPTLTIISTEEDCFGNQITWEATPVSSPGATDGAITLHVDGGIPPYTVDWSNGASGLQLNQLAAGTYIATIRDALCCTKDVEITVCAPFNMPEPDITPPSACGAADGFIYFRDSPSGGTPPYVMNWNNGANGGSLSGLATGLYIVTVTDKNGCSSVYEYPIQATGQPIVIAETQPACTAIANGYAIVNAFSQGGGPFDFYWSSGQVYYDVFETELYQLPAGAYCVTVTDDVSGCSSSICFNIAGVSEQTALAIQPITAYSCPENTTGEIQWQITGGVAPYQISWNQPGFNGVLPQTWPPVVIA